MTSARTIQTAMTAVSDIRNQITADTKLLLASNELKLFQSNRFALTYHDLLTAPYFGPATKFFLEDLYGVKDFSTRDNQFSKIAGAIDSVFPRHVVNVAVTLAQLHALSEELDWRMAIVWCALGVNSQSKDHLYVTCWKQVGRRADREQQLAMTLSIGNELAKLTRMRGLRTLLRMMRKPASVAGLSELQLFLEEGFDTFAQMAKDSHRSDLFLQTIKERETEFLRNLYR